MHGILPEPGLVRTQLDSILASSHFRNSRRCQSLLKFVVDAYLEGALERVKERTIGVEVFHRDAGYDTNQDSVVRTTAAEVRKRLAQYYMEPEHASELRVVLPNGSYAPEFQAAPPPPPVAQAIPEIAPIARRRTQSIWHFWPAALILALAAAAVWLLEPRQTALEQFWKPLFDDRAEAVICIEQPLKIFRLEGPRVDELSDKLVGSSANPPAPKEVLDATPLTLGELRAAGAQYFSFGDLMVSVRLSELLAQHRKAFQVLGDRMAGYHDLRGRPAILIGQFNNRWTLDLAAGLRYYLERDASKQLYEVHDRQQQGRVIATALRSAGRPEEYVIVSRVFNPATEKTVITIMGMTQQGTLAGGDFLTSSRYMQEAFQQAPARWYRKNIQVVLRTAMVSGAAGPPKAIATYFW